MLLKVVAVFMPERLGFYLGLFTKLSKQKWSGSVTIQPPFKPLDYLKLLGNPEEQMLIEKIKDGRRFTFAQMPRIKLLCSIEMLLGECVDQLQQECSHHGLKADNRYLQAAL